ncbi:MAG TPA: hypothetical protein PLC04_05755 [Candidatus Kapabacteria bacterium]|nr:glycosyltransferase family 39 protein [Candidatus Kapabacteria bacterium]HOV92562.1 hypothetical protein [Candidatus Kapabacteria bacterium]
MNTKKIISLIVLVLFVLFPISTFIPTSDLAIFLQGARTIADGGKLYVDFVDIKPPIAYYSMIPIYLISNMDNHIVRLIEYFIHCLTAIGLGLYLCKQVNYKVGLFSALAYSLLVVTLNTPESFQLELIFNFLIILILIIHTNNFNKEIKKSFGLIILEGAIIGLYFSLKYTTGLILLGILLFDIFYKKKNFSYFLKYYLILIVGFIASSLLCLLPLFNKEIFNGYKDMLDFLSYYINFVGTDIPSINVFLKYSSLYFVDKFSIAFIVATVFAIILWFKGREQFNTSNKQFILTLSVFLASALILSAIIERKGFAYHYSRSYIPISIILGFGINEMVVYFQNRLKNKRLNIAIPTILIILFLVVFSPISRFFAVLRIPIVFYFNNEKYYDLFQEPQNNPILNYRDKKKVGDFINSHSHQGETVLTMNAGSYDIIQFQKLKVIDKFSHSGFYYGAHIKDKWKDDYLNQLKQADWIIVQVNDFNFSANAHFRTTYESLQSDSVALEIINSRFDKVFETETIVVFHKKQNVNKSP